MNKHAHACMYDYMVNKEWMRGKLTNLIFSYYIQFKTLFKVVCMDNTREVNRTGTALKTG